MILLYDLLFNYEIPGFFDLSASFLDWCNLRCILIFHRIYYQREVMALMKGSVKHKLLLMISILILLSVSVVTVLTYQHYRTDLIEQSTRTTQELLDQLSINLDTYLDEVFRLCLSPYYNRQVMDAIESKPGNSAEKLKKQRTIEDYLAAVLMLPRSDILRAHIICGEIYTSSKTQSSPDLSNYLDTSWYKDAYSNNQTVFLPAHTEKSGRGTIEVFSVAKRINSMHDSSKPIGVIRVDANYQGIKAVCDRTDFPSGAALLVWDEAGNYIYRNNETDIDNLSEIIMASPEYQKDQTSFYITVENQQYLVNVKNLSSTSWKIIDVHSMNLLTAPATEARNRAFLFALLCALFGVLISVGLVRLFLRPIFQMTQKMETAQSGDLSVRADAVGHDEFSYLAASFNDMLAQIQVQNEQNDYLTRQIYEARYLEKEAQYTALCNQIQPHFLFNALNTIQLLIKTGNDEEAIQSISMLASLLRGMVNADRDISIQAEMKIVECYLSLQQKRFRGLSYSLPDVSHLETYLLPALTIQPIVENALVHGCELKRGNARIVVTLAENEKELLITVQDNGIGMETEQEQKLQEALHQPSTNPEQTEGGVGLVNIARRIKLKFGMEYGLSFESRQGEGTSVTLHLPLQGGEDHVSGIDC